jgi:hypothetical protein
MVADPTLPQATTNPATTTRATAPEFLLVSNRDADPVVDHSGNKFGDEAIVGQQIIATATFGPVEVFNPHTPITWSVGGKTVASEYFSNSHSEITYLPNPLITDDTTSPSDSAIGNSIFFYWIEGSPDGQNTTVSASCLMTNGKPYESDSKIFIVYTPSLSLSGQPTDQVPQSQVGILDDGRVALSLGSLVDSLSNPGKRYSTAGYTYTGSVTTPPFPDSSGILVMAQLVIGSRYETDEAGNTVLDSLDHNALDTSFPYGDINPRTHQTTTFANLAANGAQTPVDTFNNFQDSPAEVLETPVSENPGETVLPPMTTVSVRIDESFQDYFMYKPEGNSSIYVTIGFCTWNFEAYCSLVYDTDTLQYTYKTGPNPGSLTVQMVAPSSRLPSWSTNVLNDEDIPFFIA